MPSHFMERIQSVSVKIEMEKISGNETFHISSLVGGM
jgi:hypothetical protein